MHRPDQRIGPQRRGRGQRRALRQVPAPAAGAGPAHRVVQEQAGPHVRPFPDPVREREQERHRPHEVRREPGQQQPPLSQRLAHESEVQHLEVAQAAVDQLARAAGGARGQVARLDERHRKPAGGGVEGDAHAGDPASDHEHVELLAAHPRERRRPEAGSSAPSRHAVAWPMHVDGNGLAPPLPLAFPPRGVEPSAPPGGRPRADCSPLDAGASAAIAAIPRAVASRSAATSSRSSGKVGDRLQKRASAARPPPTRTARRIARRRGLQRVGDLVGHAGQRSRRQVGRGGRAALPSTVIRSAAVPVRRGQAGGRRHHHGSRPAPSRAPPPVSLRRSTPPGAAPQARFRHSRKMPPGRTCGPPRPCPRQPSQVRPPAGQAARGRRSATRTRPCRA